jgi:hypothetical protein
VSRYDPTLFVGFGGSGVSILRSVKALMSGNAMPGGPAEPVAFCAFDLDPASNGDGSDACPPLKDGAEFHSLDASIVADCVRTLIYDESRFPTIREWYPDLAGEHIRVAQASPAGAGQWRPLGRVAYSLYHDIITKRIQESATGVDAIIAGSGSAESQRNLWIVSSTAGGTGAGMLIDAATEARIAFPRWTVRGFLLLPEIFESRAYVRNIRANTYGALKELASLVPAIEKLTVEYPDGDSISAETTVSPFEDVYVIGPHRGPLRPFRDPQEACSYFAQVLETASVAGLRAASRSSTTNRSAASASDATHVFSTIAGVGIPLLSYQEFADFILVTLASELETRQARVTPMFDLLVPPTPLAEIDRVVAEVESAFNGSVDDQFAEVLDAKKLREWVEKEAPGTWTPDTLKPFVARLVQHCDIERLLENTIRTARDRCERAIASVSEDRHPVRNRATIEHLIGRLRGRRKADAGDVARWRQSLTNSLASAREFENWLTGALTERIFKRPFTSRRLEGVLDRIVKSFVELGVDGRRAVYDHIVAEYLSAELATRNEADKKAWAHAAEFAAAVKRVTADPWSERRKTVRFDVSVRSAAEEILTRELERADVRPQEADLRASLAGACRDAYDRFQRNPADAPAVARNVVDAVRGIVSEKLGRVRDCDIPLEFLPVASLLSPDSLRGAVLAAASPLFRFGRSDSHHLRVARLVVPAAYQDQEAELRRAGRSELTSADTIRDLCAGYLQATVEVKNAGRTASRESISILLEDHNHPANHLEGFPDYAADYATSDKGLHHIDRRFVGWRDLEDLRIPTGALRCGNSGCRFDIGTVPRDEIFCFGCGSPIRNRCGNAKCREDHLSSSMTSSPPPWNCPKCREPLRTAWWTCARHGVVSIDTPVCPDCVAARVPPQRRPESAGLFTCPNCTRRGLVSPTRYTGRVVRFLRDGVTRGENADARAAFDQELVGGVSCHRCGTVLAPLCPYAATSPHIVFCDEQRLACDVHTQETLYECAHCHFPVAATEPRCRRCQRALANCRFCTPVLGVRISRDDGARCPSCGLQPESPKDFVAHPAARDDDRFCSNIYGCIAGAGMLNATYMSAVHVCFHCRSSSLPLLEVFSRSYHLAACRFCTAVFGIRTNERQAKGHCCLCGQTFEKTSKMKLSEGPDRIMFYLAKALVRHSLDDRAAVRYFLRCSGVSPCDAPASFRSFLGSIARAPVRSEAARRIARMYEILRADFGCRCDSPVDECEPPPIDRPSRSADAAERSAPPSSRATAAADDTCSADLAAQIRTIHSIEGAEAFARAQVGKVTREQILEALGSAAGMNEHILNVIRATFDDLQP